MSVIAREAILKAAMEAGCDEAERLGYGSELGYVEAASIGEKAATVALQEATERIAELETLVVSALYRATIPHPFPGIWEGAVKERDEWRRISAEQQADYGQLQAENERLRAEVARLTTTGLDDRGRTSPHGDPLLDALRF